MLGRSTDDPSPLSDDACPLLALDIEIETQMDGKTGKLSGEGGIRG